MSGPYAVLKADQAVEFIELKLKFLLDGLEVLREDAMKFMDGRLEKKFFGLLLRPLSEDRKDWLCRCYIDSEVHWWKHRLEIILEKARWSKEPCGFNELYLDRTQFENFIFDAPDFVDRQRDRLFDKIREISLPGDPE